MASGVNQIDGYSGNTRDIAGKATTWPDYVKFVIFVGMLLIPVYAIARSAIHHDWVMMVIDALFVPVGFVHGLLLIFGIIG